MHNGKLYKILLATVMVFPILLSGCAQDASVTSTEISSVSESEMLDSEEMNDDVMEDADTNAEETVETVAEEMSETEVGETASLETGKYKFDLTDTQYNSINMLNHLTVLTQEINSSKNSRLYLEQAYSSIVNNYNPNAIDDRTLGELNALLDTLEDYRMTAVKRERLNYIYEQNKAQSLRDAIPKPIILLDTNKKSLVTSLIFLPIDSAKSYLTSSAQADLKYLQDGWTLDDEDAEVLHKQRKDTFSYMVKTVNENQLPGELALTEDAVNTFVEWKNNENVTARIRFFESNQDTYKAFGGYWLTLAESYYENNEYTKCLSAIKAYEDLEICIFRKDYDYAETLPIAITSAEQSLDRPEYITEAERYAESIIDNTEIDQWSPRYFAAQTYIDLYGETREERYLKAAYDIALDNVNNMVAKQRSMNDTFLKEVVNAEAEKGATAERKKEIKQYNKMLKEERKTELAPVYEPLTLNCDLLFALADEMKISDTDKQQIEQILRENDAPLFLVEELDNLYKFESKQINESEIDISFEGDKIIIPAKYVTKDSKITVEIKEKDETEKIDDWTVDEVIRKKGEGLDTFKVVYVSETADDFKYKNNMNIAITIVAEPDLDVQELNFAYDTDLSERWGFIPDKISFKRNMK